MYRNRNKRHTIRDLCMWFVLIFILGGAAFGMTRYRDVKSAVNSSFVPSGAESRDVHAELVARKPFSILLMGINTNSSISSYKGDTHSMMVLTVNPVTKKTTITTIPHDIAIKVPGFEKSSPATISSAYALGQTKTAVTSVEQLLNVPIDSYLLLNMDGMKQAIDDVKGIEVVPDASFSVAGYNFVKGSSTHMDGREAMAYISNGNDFVREDRQRAVLSALLHKGRSISTLFNQRLINSVSGQMETDLTFDSMTLLDKNYDEVGDHTVEDNLQGSAIKVSGQSMEVVNKAELQRVTDDLRVNLELSKATTGDIEYVPVQAPVAKK